MDFFWCHAAFVFDWPGTAVVPMGPMTRTEAAAFIDNLNDAQLTRIISELMWLATLRKQPSKEQSAAAGHVWALMLSAAREHTIDALTLEPVTAPMSGSAR